MPKVAIYDLTGKKTGEEIELMDYVFGVEFNEAVVHQAVVMQQANERPVPFCFQGFLPPPRTIPRVLVAWVP